MADESRFDWIWNWLKNVYIKHDWYAPWVAMDDILTNRPFDSMLSKRDWQMIRYGFVHGWYLHSKSPRGVDVTMESSRIAEVKNEGSSPKT